MHAKPSAKQISQLQDLQIERRHKEECTFKREITAMHDEHFVSVYQISQLQDLQM